jgi:hypothetical protein
VSRAHTRSRQLWSAGLAIALVLLGLLPRAGDASDAALAAGGALILSGLLLDVYARAAGAALAFAERKPPAWIWACAVGGSPVALLYALRRADGGLRPDPAELSAVLTVVTVLAVVFVLAGD